MTEKKNKRNQKLALASIIAILLMWEILVYCGYINVYILSSPTRIFFNFKELFNSPNFYTDIFSSIIRILIGFVLGSFVAVSAGFLCAKSNIFNSVFHPIIELLRPIPPIAFIPITILIWGLGYKSSIFLVGFGTFFPVFSNTLSGVTNIPQEYIDTAKSLGAQSKQIFTQVVWQAALPQIFIGLRTGLGIAWFCVIVSEMVGTQSGLGYMIQMNRLNLNSDNVLCGMIMIGCIGASMSFLIKQIEKWALPWIKS